MTGRLQDSVALITGSDSGIGQATAIEFAREGADVVVNYLDDEEGAGHTREKVEAAGRRAIVIGADVSDEEQVGDMFDRAVEEFGTVDILMNNAGVDASGTEVADLSTEVWNKAIKTNVYGYFYCCRRFINIRKEAGGGGKIINITSVHQEQPRAGAADYDCSKARVNTIPGILYGRDLPSNTHFRCGVRSSHPRLFWSILHTPNSRTEIQSPKAAASRIAGVEKIPTLR